jgi:hypothetical protein
LRQDKSHKRFLSPGQKLGLASILICWKKRHYQEEKKEKRRENFVNQHILKPRCSATVFLNTPAVNFPISSFEDKPVCVLLLPEKEKKNSVRLREQEMQIA